ncbi:hypothetical protein L3Q67_00985 [Saccharothrix sp. AJ9571]|nr:hypothetical protein L3Q67_00985 [Saccharothrix sp. AJ9571]
MALGDPYSDRDVIKKYTGLTDDDEADDAEIDAAIGSVAREINGHCGRQFNLAAEASARIYDREHTELVYVDDFASADGLIVATDDAGDGSYSAVWSPADYQLEPLNGVVDGDPGWPFWAIRAVGGRRFPAGRHATVRVTARWGWSAVPDPVAQASKILAAETLKLREAPFGVAGFGDFGAVRVRDNPMAAKKLAPFVRTPILSRGRD